MEGPSFNFILDQSILNSVQEKTAIEESSGILPRTAEFVFKEIHRIRSQGKKDYSIEISSLEIYCENVRDLYSDLDTAN